jgi:hypothetical protein
MIPIFFIKEKILTAVSAQNYMIEPTRDVKSWFSSHGQNDKLVSSLIQLRRLGPIVSQRCSELI